MANFQEIYVKIAEATAASRDALDATVAPLGDTSDYDGSGSDGNIRVIVDTVTEAGTTWTETGISPVQFEISTLIPANSTWTQMQDLATSNSPYNSVVTALNNFVITYVLGATTDNSGSGGTYQSTLQGFIDNDCKWTDPSVGCPASWISLSVANGFSVVDSITD